MSKQSGFEQNNEDTLTELTRYEEALDAYEQAIRLDPNLAFAYNNKGECSA